MALGNLIPWRRGEIAREGDPFVALHREMDELVERFFGNGQLPFRPLREFTPSVDVSETDKEIEVRAEIPGMDEKDIELSLADDCLMIRGEKRAEKKEEDGGRHHVECSYGAFERRIALPSEVEADKVKAKYKKGLLTVTLPKTARARNNAKKIAISSAA